MFNEHAMDLFMRCEIWKYSQVYEPYQSIFWQKRGWTHIDLYERKKINQILAKLILI